MSAINTLQELTTKQGYLPTYEFPINKANEFHCTCTCKQWKAHGTGSNKKEAKHNAAKNMLALLNNNNEISVPNNILSSFLMTNVNQTPKMVNKTSLSYESSSYEQPTIFQNYVGLLNEFCQQQDIKNIDYQLISTSSLEFKIEVSIKSFKEVGIGRCKKTAKQEAAKKMLEHLGFNLKDNKIRNETNRLTLETLKKTMQELNVEILDSVSKEKTKVDNKAKEIAEKGKSLYLKHKKKNSHSIDHLLINIHLLFEQNYSTRISQDLKKKMQIVQKKGYVDEIDFIPIKQSIIYVFQAEIQEKSLHSVTDNRLISMKLLSNPPITQIGIGKTNLIAKYNVMYKLISTILLLLNI